MKFNKIESKIIDVKYLQVCAYVRYWEDAQFSDGEEIDEEGKLMPCKDGNCWMPLINVDTGVIENWDKGKSINIHFKVCDAGVYELQDENKKQILRIEGYVPDCMCPAGNGYGDYIIMNIDENGKIENWKPEFSDFKDYN